MAESEVVATEMADSDENFDSGEEEPQSPSTSRCGESCFYFVSVHDDITNSGVRCPGLTQRGVVCDALRKQVEL